MKYISQKICIIYGLLLSIGDEIEIEDESAAQKYLDAGFIVAADTKTANTTATVTANTTDTKTANTTATVTANTTDTKTANTTDTKTDTTQGK